VEKKKNILAELNLYLAFSLVVETKEAVELGM
jgi:hypothetical protein